MSDFSEIVEKLGKVAVTIGKGFVIWFLLFFVFLASNDFVMFDIILSVFVMVMFLQPDTEIKVLALIVSGIVILFSWLGFVSAIKMIAIVLLGGGVGLVLIEKFGQGSAQIESYIRKLVGLFNRKKAHTKYRTAFEIEWQDYNHLNPFAGRYSYRRGDDYLEIRKAFFKSNKNWTKGDVIAVQFVEDRTLLQRFLGLSTVIFYSKKGKVKCVVENVRASKVGVLLELIKETKKNRI